MPDSAESSGQTRTTDWGSLQWLASREMGNAQGLTLGRVVIRKGCANPRHRHDNCEEALYLLKGRLEHSVGDDKVVLEPGDVIVIPPGVSHHAVSIGEEDAEAVIAYDAGERHYEGESEES